MAELTDVHRRFLESPFVGTVTDLRADGSPHSTVVWVDVDQQGVSFNTAHGRCKPRNIARDPRVSLLVVDPNDPYRWLTLHGTADLVDEGADAQIDRLSLKYLGQESYPWRKPEERRVSVRISPERVESSGLD